MNPILILDSGASCRRKGIWLRFKRRYILCRNCQGRSIYSIGEVRDDMVRQRRSEAEDAPPSKKIKAGAAASEPAAAAAASLHQTTEALEQDEASEDDAVTAAPVTERTLRDAVTPLWRLDYAEQLKVFN